MRVLLAAQGHILENKSKQNVISAFAQMTRFKLCHSCSLENRSDAVQGRYSALERCNGCDLWALPIS